MQIKGLVKKKKNATKNQQFDLSRVCQNHSKTAARTDWRCPNSAQSYTFPCKAPCDREGLLLLGT